MAGKKVKTFDDFSKDIEKKELQKDRRGYSDNENKVGNLPNVMKSKFDKNTRKWTDISRDMIDDKIDAIDSIKESNEHEHTSWLQSRIQESRAITDEAEKLDELRFIAEEIANQFTYDMQILEEEIENVLDETSEKVKSETGYWSVEDITQDINVTRSGEH